MAPKFHFPDSRALFERFLRYAINILILYVIVILAIGLVKTIAGGSVLWGDKSFSTAFPSVITDILSFLVIIELFKGFIDYFSEKRFSLHALLDPAILFVIRETIVYLYDEHYDWKTIAAFSCLILVLAIARTLAVRYSPAAGHEDEGAEAKPRDS